MKTKSILTTLIVTLAVITLAFQSCQKEEENNQPPKANFSTNITAGALPLSVNFTDQSINNPTSWQWDFGDGGNSTQANPTHTYNTDGFHTVSLTVANEFGSDTKTRTDYIYADNGEGGQPCPGTPTVTDADGNVYNTVQIGEQCWMKENLRVGTLIDGSQEMTSGNGIEKYCYFDDPVNCETYGGLYQWNEMMQYTTTPGVQGICPSGWHLPTDDEWKELEIYLGMSQTEADDIEWRGTNQGKQMKSTSGWYADGNGINSSGFTALPGGFRFNDGVFQKLGERGTFWSSSEGSVTSAWYRNPSFNYDQVYRNNFNKNNAFSCRCIKD
jgi:uncharacterized protein (TIGR02145 family)